jgi:hypothetical protein
LHIFQAYFDGIDSFHNPINICIYLADSIVQLILLLLGIPCAADEFVGGEADGDGVEDDLIKELNALINGHMLAECLHAGLAISSLEVLPVDPVFEAIEPHA